MRKIKLLIASVLTLGGTFVFAQQEFQYSNYTQNPYLYNPAAGGLTDFTQVDLGYRNQFISSSGNPVTPYFSGTVPLYFKKAKLEQATFNPENKMMYAPPLNGVGKFKHVVGGKVIGDMIGPFRKTGIMASYAVHLPMTSKVSFGAGLGLGWNNMGVRSSQAIVHDETDLTYQEFSSKWSQNNLDMQLGFVVYTDRLTVGLSGTQLLGNKLKFSDAFYKSKLNSHWMLFSSYKWAVAGDFVIEPYMMLRVVKNAPFSADLGSKFHYKYVWIGAQYRTAQSFAVSFGLNFLKNIYLSYAFEYSAKSIRVANAGTHEVQIGFFIGKSKNAKTPELDTDKTQPQEKEESLEK
jgi:type IX secretion system PorP/SprF family membrane protein